MKEVFDISLACRLTGSQTVSEPNTFAFDLHRLPREGAGSTQTWQVQLVHWPHSGTPALARRKTDLTGPTGRVSANSANGRVIQKDLTRAHQEEEPVE